MVQLVFSQRIELVQDRSRAGQGVLTRGVKFFAKSLKLKGKVSNAGLVYDGNENRRLALSVVDRAMSSVDAPRIVAIVSTTRATWAGSFRLPRWGRGDR